MRHQWVKHTITEVDVVADIEDEGAIVAFSSQDNNQAAEESAVFGCMRCQLPLNPHTAETACQGES